MATKIAERPQGQISALIALFAAPAASSLSVQ
jgi:hypothetical protein